VCASQDSEDEEALAEERRAKRKISVKVRQSKVFIYPYYLIRK